MRRYLAEAKCDSWAAASNAIRRRGRFRVVEDRDPCVDFPRTMTSPRRPISCNNELERSEVKDQRRPERRRGLAMSKGSRTGAAIASKGVLWNGARLQMIAASRESISRKRRRYSLEG